MKKGARGKDVGGVCSFYVSVMHEGFLNQLQNVRRLLKKEIEELGLDSSSEPYIPILKAEYNPTFVGSILLYAAMDKLKANSQNKLEILGINLIDELLETQLSTAEVFFYLHIEEVLTRAMTMLIDLSLLYASDKQLFPQSMIQPIIDEFVDNTIKAVLPMRSRGGRERTVFSKEKEFPLLFEKLYPLWRDVKKAYKRIKKRPQSQFARRKRSERTEEEYIELLRKEMPQAADLPTDLLAKLSHPYEGEPKRLAVKHACRKLEIEGISYRKLERLISKNKRTVSNQ